MLAWAIPASAAPVVTTLVNDTFTDGARTDGVDAFDANWYALANASLAVNSTAPVVGTGNGLVGTISSSGGGSVNRIGAMFSASQLVNVGDSISVSFNYLTTGSASGGFSPAFGLYNSGGTAITSDASNAATMNDVGYYASTGANVVSPSSIIYTETTITTANGIADTNGPLAGGDQLRGEGGVADGSAAGPAPALNLQTGNIGHFSLTLARVLHTVTADTNGDTVLESYSRPAIQATFTLENVSAAPGTVYSVVGYYFDAFAGDFGTVDKGGKFYDTFDTFYFRSRQNSYKIDDIQVTLTTVPEPSVAGLAACAGLAALRRRRSHRVS